MMGMHCMSFTSRPYPNVVPRSVSSTFSQPASMHLFTICTVSSGAMNCGFFTLMLAPVRRLLQAGVPVALASNNIRNPFTTVGTADLAHMAFLAAVAAHMGTPDDLIALIDTVTTHPARIMRLQDRGLAAGGRADLVLWEGERAEDVVAALAPRAAVLKDGRLTVEHTRRVRERWREGIVAPTAGASG